MEWLAAAIAAIASSLVTYLVARRAASGKIDVTEANKLWEEASTARRELRRRIRDLEANEIARRIEIHGLRNEMTKMQFLVAGKAIPQEVKDALIKSAEDHIADLRKQWEAKQSEPLNGG